MVHGQKNIKLPKQMYKYKTLSFKIYDIKNVKIYNEDKIFCVSVM